jgi:hypothetical protein
MASDKYFLFRREDITEYSEVFSNNGDNLSILAISADHVGYITAKRGKVVIIFNNAGLYDTDGGSDREALAKTRVEVGCKVGDERTMLNKILEFITSPNTSRRVLKFDAVTGVSNFQEAELAGKLTITTIIPKQPTVMSSQQISNDPASIDLTQTTTTTIDDIAFTSPTLMPIVDYNPSGLDSYAIGAEIGQTHNWHNTGTGGSTYDLDSNTDAPVKIGSRDCGIRGNAVDIGASPEQLNLKNQLVVEDDYTMYMVIGAVDYASWGGSIVDGGSYTRIGFAEDDTGLPLNSQFWVRHDVNLQGGPVAHIDTTATEYDTESYRYPDPKLTEGVLHTGEVGQTCYVFVLRRDKEYNMYLHNHTGEMVGYIPASTSGLRERTDGDLEIDNIGTGFRGYLGRFGVIPSDIGAAEANRIARDMYEKYYYRY